MCTPSDRSLLRAGAASRTRLRLTSMNGLRLSAVIAACSIPACRSTPPPKVETSQPPAPPPHAEATPPKAAEPPAAPKVVEIDPSAHCSYNVLEEDDEGGGFFVNENFLGIRPGSNPSEVRAAFGEPETVSSPEEEGASGDMLWVWRYPAQGVSVTMGSSSGDPSRASVDWISIGGSSTVRTALGLGIGSSLEDMRSIYRPCMSSPDDVPTFAVPSIVIGSHYDGLWVGATDGKVSSMSLGGAE